MGDLQDNTEKGYRTTDNSRHEVQVKTLPSTPQDAEMDEQDEKPFHKDSLELPHIQPTKRLMP